MLFSSIQLPFRLLFYMILIEKRRNRYAQYVNYVFLYVLLQKLGWIGRGVPMGRDGGVEPPREALPKRAPFGRMNKEKEKTGKTKTEKNRDNYL